MKNDTHRGSTKIRMNFKNKTRGTSETNKSFNHCDLEWRFKIKHRVCQKPKNLTRMKSKSKLWMDPEFAHKLTLNLK